MAKRLFIRFFDEPCSQLTMDFYRAANQCLGDRVLLHNRYSLRLSAVLTFNFFSACVDFFEAKLTGPRRHGDSTQRTEAEEGNRGGWYWASTEDADPRREGNSSFPCEPRRSSALESFFDGADSTSASFGCGIAALGAQRLGPIPSSAICVSWRRSTTRRIP